MLDSEFHSEYTMDITKTRICPWCKELMYSREEWRKTVNEHGKYYPIDKIRIITSMTYCCDHIICHKCLNDEIIMEDICPFCEEETISDVKYFHDENQLKEYLYDERGKWKIKNTIPIIKECNTCKYCSSNLKHNTS
jgi:hypothetical protein